ncbi:MAG: hypothetical protein FWF28_10490 [Micrococcales bacterium]|nr:hypothetical protein [Micrococcales bacterium]
MSEEKNKTRTRVSFSLPQILGGALAAATAATIGSTLGTAGTIIGAALASVVGGVAGTLYTAGIDRGGRGAWTAMRKGYAYVVSNKPDDPHAGDAPRDTSPAESDADQESPPDDLHEAGRHSIAALETVPATTTDGTEGATGPEEPAPPVDREQHAANHKRLIWAIAGSVAAAALIFVIAFAVITGVEVAKGSSLSGGKGTTVSKVVNPQPTPSTPKPAKSPTSTPPTSAPPTTPQPTQPPTETPTSEPSATDEPSAAPSPELPTAPAPTVPEVEPTA